MTAVAKGMGMGKAMSNGMAVRVTLGVVVLVVALVIAEFVTRAVIEHRVASLARQQLHGGSLAVGLGATPALIDLIRGYVGHLDLRAEHVHIGDMPDVSIDATLRDVSLSGAHRVRATDALVTISRSTLDTLASRATGVPGISVSPRPGAGTLDVSALSRGAVDVIAAPTLKGDRLILRPRRVRVFGIDLSGTSLQNFVERHAAAQSLAGLPLALSPRSLRVVADGLQIVFHGGSALLTAASGHAGSTAGAP